MAIVDMRIGDPMECDEPPDVVVFLLPTTGLGRGYASKVFKCDKDSARLLGKAYSMASDKCVHYGLVAHEDGGYEQAPQIMKDFLEDLCKMRSHKSPVAVVISGRDMPVNVRFEFMATLARAKLPIKLFDFPSS